VIDLQAASAPPAKRRARDALDAGLDSTPPAWERYLEPRGGLRSDQPLQRKRDDRSAAGASGGGINSRLTSSTRLMASMSTGAGRVASAVVQKARDIGNAVAAARGHSRGDRRSSGSAAEKRAAGGAGPSSRTRKRKSASQVSSEPSHTVAGSGCSDKCSACL